jgi:hypothetical protein
MANKLSGTMLTTSNTNISQSIWTATSTNTAYTPNINNQFVYSGPSIDQQPFNIRFNWNNKEVVVSLKDGNDVFKLANKFMKWLDMNEIEYNVKTKKWKK